MTAGIIEVALYIVGFVLCMGILIFALIYDDD